ncbi:MAG: hypothetical protein BroJett040_00420 [Oligoflexia bacterium]|nr:MAG: hypothetical protein BroJett040_00420 [Oligoflexia bacterium]
MVKEISVASKEQATGVGGINQAVMEFDRLAKENEIVSSEASRASQELNIEADRLSSLVGELKDILEGRDDSFVKRAA